MQRKKINKVDWFKHIETHLPCSWTKLELWLDTNLLSICCELQPSVVSTFASLFSIMLPDNKKKVEMMIRKEGDKGLRQKKKREREREREQERETKRHRDRETTREKWTKWGARKKKKRENTQIYKYIPSHTQKQTQTDTHTHTNAYLEQN